VQIQYLGFQVKPRGRDYLYLVVDPKSENREFVFTISNQSFAVSKIPYQDAADFCYQKLRKSLDGESQEQPLPRHCVPADQEFVEYLLKHRAARRRSW
jgi:hypothetical protein